MKKIILKKEEYTFNVSNKEVIFLNHTELLTKESLLLITNTTTNQIIYNFGCSGFGGVINFNNNSIVLEFDTSTMSNSDNLQIVLYTEQTQSDIISEKLLIKIDDNTSILNDILEELKQQTFFLKLIAK